MNTTAKTFQENEHHCVPKRETVNGNRPSPLKINRESYIIHKQQPSTSSYNSRMTGYHKPPQQRQHPVIIYTHSPKVIHTRPHDFMALVQKLTGLSRSFDQDPVIEDDQTYEEAAAPQTLGAPQVQDPKKDSNVNDNETSSGVTDDENNVHHIGRDNSSSDFKASSPAARFTGFSPMQQQTQQHPYFADLPFFTPTSTDHHHFLSSPRPLYRFSDSGSQASPSTLYGSISPSVFKFIKGLPEY